MRREGLGMRLNTGDPDIPGKVGIMHGLDLREILT
jgi:hypothetical protein